MGRSDEDDTIEQRRRQAQEVADRVIGLDENAAVDLAAQRGVLIRVVARDGVRNPMTLEMVPGRVGVEIQEGRVVAAEPG